MEARTSVSCAKEQLALFPIVASLSKGATPALLGQPSESAYCYSPAYVCAPSKQKGHDLGFAVLDIALKLMLGAMPIS